MKESSNNILKYGYAMEKMTTISYMLTYLGEGTNAPDRLSAALSEMWHAKDEIAQDRIAKPIYDEIISMIDYSKKDKEKGIYKRNIEEMPKAIQFYLFYLFFKLYFRIEELFRGTDKLEREPDPEIVEWKRSIKQTYADYQKEIETQQQEK